MSSTDARLAAPDVPRSKRAAAPAWKLEECTGAGAPSDAVCFVTIESAKLKSRGTAYHAQGDNEQRLRSETARLQRQLEQALAANAQLFEQQRAMQASADAMMCANAVLQRQLKASRQEAAAAERARSDAADALAATRERMATMQAECQKQLSELECQLQVAHAAQAAQQARVEKEMARTQQYVAMLQIEHRQQEADHARQLQSMGCELARLHAEVKRLEAENQRNLAGYARCHKMAVDANVARSLQSKKVPVKKMSELADLTHIGDGGCAVVYSASVDGRKVAVKVAKAPFASPVSVMKEAAMMIEMGDAVPQLLFLLEDDHPHRQMAGTSCLVGFGMELYEGSLDELLSDLEPSHADVLHMCVAICDALAVVQEQGYAHMDVKLSNILYRWRTDGSLDLKFGDLGMARKRDANGEIDDFPGGTYSHMDPLYANTTSGRVNGAACDARALAMTWLQVLLGEELFEVLWEARQYVDARNQVALAPLDVEAMVREAFETSSSAAERGLQAEWVRLLRRMTEDVAGRPDARQAGEALQEVAKRYAAAVEREEQAQHGAQAGEQEQEGEGEWHEVDM